MAQRKFNNLKIILVKSLFVFCFVVLLFSCQSKTEKRLIGLWALDLDSCVVLNSDWHTEICSNAMIIGQKQVCDLPSLCKQNVKHSKGTWELALGKNAPDTILFNVPNNPLRGSYVITFYKDYNAMKFKMKLQNDSTLLICSKSVVDFTSTPKKILDKQ